MSDVLQDLSKPALVVAIKANLFEYYRYLSRSPQVELYEGPRLTWLLTGILHPFLNNVLRTQLDPDHVDESIEATLAHFQSRGMTKLSWWTEPGTQPADLGEHLLAHGLTYTEGGPGMAADLLALNEDVTAPSDLVIRRVGDIEALRKWVRASAAGFALPDKSKGPCIDLFTGLGFELPLRNYVGLLNGEPLAAAQLFLGAGVAGIYWVSTVPEARRQGIGTALTLAPLREARAMGYRIGILHSAPLGLGVYSRLGFQEYCRMSHYFWTGESGQERD